MATTETTYFGLIRLREQSPEAKDWAAVDRDPETIALILKMFESHAHNGAAGINYPGYDPIPANIIYPTLTSASGGVLGPGATVSTRLSYLNAFGLETDGSPERTITLSSSVSRPLAPTLASGTNPTPAPTGVTYLAGGTYIYVVTKLKGSGETIASDVLTVGVPYDQTYSVRLQFDAINTYTDGTTGINIYRSAGLNSQFQLISTITTVTQTTFVDINSVPSTNAGVQPPTTNTFDANKKVTIDWSAMTPPVGAVKMRVYVTQQIGMWATQHLLTEVGITSGAFDSPSIDYLGSESLASGWPNNTTQIPSNPPQVNLASDTTGGFNLSANADFNGYKAIEMVLGNSSLSSNGAIWYDNVNHKVKAYVNGAQVDMSPLKTMRNEVKNPTVQTATGYTDGNTGTGLGAPPSPTYSVTPTTGTVAGRQCFTGTLTSVSAPAGGTIDLRYGDSTSTWATIAPGETIFITADAYANIAVGTSLYVRYFDASTAQVGALATLVTATSLSSSTWTTLSGSVTVPSTAVWAQVEIRFTASTLNVAGTVIAMSQVGLIRGTSAGSYFDGTMPGCYWEGTAYASTSLSGAFQHGVEEAGGHQATHITLGSSNVSNALGRIVNVNDGTSKQATVLAVATGTTSGPTTTSSTAATLPEMTATITPEFAGQLIKITFSGQFAISELLSELGLNLKINGSVVAASARYITAAVANQQIPVEFVYYYTAPDTAADTILVQWFATPVSSTTVTAVGTSRQLIVEAVL